MSHSRFVSHCLFAACSVLSVSGAVFAQAAPQSGSSTGAAPTDTSTPSTASTTPAPTGDSTTSAGPSGTAVVDNARMNAASGDVNSMAPHDPNRLLMREVGSTLSLGWRVWYQSVPGFIVGLFAKIEDGWAGGGGAITGPELVYRNGSVDIALAVQYAGYYAGTGHLHGLNEGINATEQIRADLWSVQVTSHFLYGIRANRYFEFQIGAGIGAGFMGGQLRRYQARPTPGTTSGFTACTQADRMPSEPCNQNVNNHFADTADATTGYGSGGYSENNWIASGGGYVPLIIPWLSLPHMALHFRPHRNFDFRLEGGFGLINFYGGGSIHYVF